MKTIFYLNLEKKEFLKQKCSAKKYIQGFKRSTLGKNSFIIDSGSQSFPARQKNAIKPRSRKRLNFKRRTNKKKKAKQLSIGVLSTKKTAFFKNDVIIKVRFSRVLFLQSFLLTHQKEYADFATKYKESFQMLKRSKFCTLLVLKRKRGGFLARVAGFVCFIPKKQFLRAVAYAAYSYDQALLLQEARSIVLFLLKVCFKLGTGRDCFYYLTKNSFLIQESLPKKKLVLNRALFSSKIPLAHFRSKIKVKILTSYYRKNLRKSLKRKKRRQRSRGRKNRRSRIKLVLLFKRNSCKVGECNAGSVFKKPAKNLPSKNYSNKQ